jgi:hypothetical protein
MASGKLLARVHTALAKENHVLGLRLLTAGKVPPVMLQWAHVDVQKAIATDPNGWACYVKQYPAFIQARVRGTVAPFEARATRHAMVGFGLWGVVHASVWELLLVPGLGVGLSWSSVAALLTCQGAVAFTTSSVLNDYALRAAGLKGFVRELAEGNDEDTDADADAASS